MRRKTFIYPTYTPSKDKSGNRYIKFFHDAFGSKTDVKLVNRFWRVGIASLMFNFDASLVIVHWVDLIPQKKFGKIQFVVFVILISLMKLIGKDIVWVLHNKQAHKGKSAWVDYGMSFMAKKANLVVAHSEEGVSFFDEKYVSEKGKCVYIPHPVYYSGIYDTLPIEYDYIIWGTITQRKNVLEFLKYSKDSKFMRKKKILICGYCPDKDYDKEITETITPNITYINRFLSDVELQCYIRKSKVILFTYNEASVLSSGALIYSLNFAKNIVGPRVGSFKDLEGIVSCYDTFSDIEDIRFDADVKEKVKDYIKQNQWASLPDKILQII